ncbi:MAG TPA: serine protease [Gemmatimonadales bacterium]|nr:serine protease [Gemmatimonadales bacterium]
MSFLHRGFRRGVAALGVLLAALPALGHAQEPGSSASEAFRRYGGQVLKVQVHETSSAAKASIGSGFLVGADGLVITNYHVVADLVTEPGRYRVEVIGPDGEPDTARVVALDVVHDLAILATPLRPAAWFTLSDASLTKGARLYSLGNPEDLGLAIVEGTYNGLLEHTLYPHIHFTGAINPGMSGGPALLPDGRVVGINVSTAGNELGFLVPAGYAAALLARSRAAGYRPPADWMEEVGRQMLAYQREYVRGLFVGGPRATFGRYEVPTKPAPFFRCWADRRPAEEQLYSIVDHRCSTDDDVFIAGDLSSGSVTLRHRYLGSAALNPTRFAALLQKIFEPGDEGMEGTETHLTNFRCRTRNVAREGHVLRVAFCLRRYRKLAGLYDAVVKVATPGDGREGIVSTLTLAGVSDESAMMLARRFLESFRWTK